MFRNESSSTLMMFEKKLLFAFLLSPSEPFDNI